MTLLARCSFVIAFSCAWGCKSTAKEGSQALPSASQRAASAAPSTSTAAQLPTPPAARARPSFERGLRATYTMQLESDAAMQGSPLTQFTLAATLELLAVDANTERTLLRGKLSNPRLKTALPGKDAEFRALEPDLAQLFVFELLPGNVLGEVWVAARGSTLAAGIHKVLAAAVQGGDRGETTFLATEQDTVGHYQARYERGSAPGLLEKRKLSYSRSTLQLGAKLPAAQLPDIEESRATLRFDESARLVSASATERVVANSMVGSVVSRSSVSLERTAVAVIAQVPDAQELLTNLRRFDTLSLPSKAPEQTDTVRIAGRSLQQVLDGLRAQGATPADGAGKEGFADQRADLFGALQALIREQTPTSMKLSALIAAGDPLSPLLLDALSASGAAPAQRAMLALLSDNRLDKKQRRMVAISLSRSQRPTRETTDALIALLNDPSSRTQAMYGLGTCIRRLRTDGEHLRAGQLLEVVLAKLAAADSTVPRVTALRALANAGDEAAFPKVKPLLQADDEEVRAAAVESLQLVNLPEAVTALSTALTKDASREVRLAAARAMFAHEPAPQLVEATSSAARSDQNAHVRLGAVRALAGWLTLRPDLRAVLTEIARTESEREIRDVALATLSGASPAPRPDH